MPSCFVKYHPICRNCGIMDGVSHRFELRTSNDQEYEMYVAMTEYEFSIAIRDWFDNLEIKCNVCGSTQMFPYDIWIGSKKLYDYERLVAELQPKGNSANLLLIGMYKDGDKIELQKGGKEPISLDFLASCLTTFNAQLNELPDSLFMSNERNARFEIFISGEVITSQPPLYDEQHILKIERMIYYGFDKEEVRDRVNNYLVDLDFRE